MTDKQLDKMIDDFKLFPFVWSMIKLGFKIALLWCLGMVGLFLFYCVIILIIAMGLPHP